MSNRGVGTTPRDSSPEGRLVGREVIRIIDAGGGGSGAYEVYGVVTSELVHPLYGQLFSCTYTNVMLPQEDAARDVIFDAASARQRVFALENCSELTFPADLELVPGATSSNPLVHRSVCDL
jgi:hypothetical protein